MPGFTVSRNTVRNRVVTVFVMTVFFSLCLIGRLAWIQIVKADELYDQAVDLVVKTNKASISMVQRRLRIGYNRAARMIELMERDGLVSKPDGSKPRQVLVRKEHEVI